MGGGEEGSRVVPWGDVLFVGGGGGRMGGVVVWDDGLGWVGLAWEGDQTAPRQACLF